MSDSGYAGTRPKLLILGESQNWRCAYCGIGMTYPSSFDHDAATVDHVVPLCAGGPRTYRNEVAACRMCNGARGAMVAATFFWHVQRKGRAEAATWARARAKRKRKEKRDSFAPCGRIRAPQFGLGIA